MSTISLLVRIGLIAACLGYAFYGTDLHAFGEALKRFDPVRLCVMAAVYTFPVAIMAARIYWQGERRISYQCCVVSMFVSLAINNILPAKAGELVKVFYFKNKCDIPMSQGMSVVFWERFADLNMILIFGLGAAMLSEYSLTILPMLGAVLGCWTIVFLIRFRPRILERMALLVPFPRLRQFVIDTGMHSVNFLSFSRIGTIFFWSVAIWGQFLLGSYLGLNWLAGLELNAGQVLFIFIFQAIAFAIPLSPGGLGVFEAAMVFSLGVFGYEKNTALAIGMTLHLLQLIPITAIGLVLFLKNGLSISQLLPSNKVDS